MVDRLFMADADEKDEVECFPLSRISTRIYGSDRLKVGANRPAGVFETGS